MIDGLPTLSKGAHSPDDGKACVMECVALLAGEEWTDTPSCTHPVLARTAQVVNDRLPDSERHRLVPLIGRLFGTAPAGTEYERKVLSVRLAVWCARRTLHLVPADRRTACERAIDTAEAWCRGETTVGECRANADAAAGVGGAYAYAADAVAYAAYGAASAAATDATTYAGGGAAAAANAANAAALSAHLSDLLDEYDRLTGRTQHREVTDAELHVLAQRVTT